MRDNDAKSSVKKKKYSFALLQLFLGHILYILYNLRKFIYQIWNQIHFLRFL